MLIGTTGNTATPTGAPPVGQPEPDAFTHISEDAVIIEDAPAQVEPTPEDDGPSYDDGGERETLEQDMALAEQEPSPVVVPAPEPKKASFLTSTVLEPLPDRPKPKSAEELEKQFLSEEPAQEPGQALALHRPSGQVSLQEANDPISLLKWGTIIYESRTFPKMRSAQEVVVRVLMARSLQIDEMKAMYLIHIIDDKPVLSADLMRYLIDRSKVIYKVDIDHAPYHNPMIASNPAGAVNDFLTRISMKQEATNKKVSWDLWWSECLPYRTVNKKVWENFPRMMHIHACVRICARFYFPGILGGLFDPEELGIDAEKTFATEV